VWRDVKVVGVGNVARVFFAKALVRGDVDPRCSGLGAREADGGAIVIEVRALCCQSLKKKHLLQLSLTAVKKPTVTPGARAG
jgi:hypothetical protein